PSRAKRSRHHQTKRLFPTEEGAGVGDHPEGKKSDKLGAALTFCKGYQNLFSTPNPSRGNKKPPREGRRDLPGPSRGHRRVFAARGHRRGNVQFFLDKDLSTPPPPTRRPGDVRALYKGRGKTRVYCGAGLFGVRGGESFGVGVPCDLGTGEGHGGGHFSKPPFTSRSRARTPSPSKTRPGGPPFFHHQRFIRHHGMLSVNELPREIPGEETAVPIVKEICRELNEEVVVNTYKTLSPLEVSSGACGAFMAPIFRHKCPLEGSPGSTYAVLHNPFLGGKGASLTPPNPSYKVMGAWGSVGMGPETLIALIRRVVFDALEKFDGKGVVQVPMPQIASPSVSRMTSKTILTYAMNKRIPPLQKVGVQPDFDSLKLFSYQFPNDNMGQLLFKYSVLATPICFGEEQLRIGALLAPLPLTHGGPHGFHDGADQHPRRGSPPSPSRYPLPTPGGRAHSQGRVALINDFISLPPPRHPMSILPSSKASRWPITSACPTMCDVARAAELKATIEKRIDFMLPRVHLSFEARKLPKHTFKR
ncbi:RNA helicase, partial [Massospora cicadina]